MALNIYVEFTNDEMAPAGVPDAPDGFTTFPVDGPDGEGTTAVSFCASRISYQGGDAGSVDPIEVTFDISSTVVQILSNSGEDGSIHFSGDSTEEGPALGFQPVSVSDFSSGIGGYVVVLVGFSQSDDPTSTLNITTPTGYTAQSVPHNGMYVALKDTLVTPSETPYEPPSTSPYVDPSTNGTILWTISFRAVFADADATYTGEGGIIVGGGFSENSTGVKIGGVAETGDRLGSGGVEVSGSANVEKIQFLTNDGCLVGGSANSYTVHAIKGGILLGGDAVNLANDGLLKPNGTASNSGNWYGTPDLGSNNLHLNLDNNIYDFSDYVTSNGENSKFRVRIENLGPPNSGKEWQRLKIWVAGRKSTAVAGTSTITMKVYVDNILQKSQNFAFSTQSGVVQTNSFSAFTKVFSESQLDKTEIEVSLPFYFGGDVDLFGFGLEVEEADFVEGSGGTRIGGRAVVSVSDAISGGIICGLSSAIGGSTTAIPSGGLIANGVGAQEFNVEGSGGLKAFGSSFAYRAFNFYGTNGVLLNGSFVSFPSYIGRGGIDISGEGFEESYVNYNYNVDSEEEDFAISGNAFISIGLPPVVGGNVFVEGEAGLNFGWRYIATGNISVSGSVGLSIVRRSQKEFIFNIRTEQSLEKNFNWNTGNIPLSHFRIISECLPENSEICQPISDPNDACDRRSVVTITASTPGDVCNQLLKRNFRFPILKFDKFSRPAQNSQLTLDAENGNNNDCNELIPIEFCEIPECFEFCIDFDAIQLIESEFTMSFYEVYSYVGDGNLSISGTSEIESVENISEFEEFGTEGVLISGLAELSTTSNFYIASGSVLVEGINSGDNIKSTAYSYSQFVCPYDYPTESFITSSQSGVGQNWTDINRIFDNDDIPAYVLLESNLVDDDTVSESKNLLAKIIPYFIDDNRTINGITVIIKKKGLGGFDEEIKLVGPNGIVSENKAKPESWSNDYETYVYGSDHDTWGIEWDTEDLNSEDFGVSIKVAIPPNAAHGFTKNLFIDYVYIIVSTCEENDVDNFLIDGDALVKSNRYYMEPTGGVTIVDSEENLYINYNYNSSGILNILGSYSQNQEYESGGEITINGNLLGTDLISSVYQYNSSLNEVVVESVFEDLNVVSSSWSYSVDENNNIVTQGSSIVRVGYILETTGEYLYVDGAASKNYSYISSGGVSISQNIIPEFDKLSFDYVSSGSIEIDESGAFLRFSDLGTFDLNIEAEFTIFDLVANFSETDLEELTLPTDRIFTNCGQGCRDIPLSVDLNHNIVSNNKLSHFLFRNGLFMDSTFVLKYNSVNNCWQSNFHFKGIGDSGNNELWNIVFELKCTQVVAGVEIGKSLLQLGVSVFQNNLDTGEDYDTRIISVFDPIEVCSENSNLIFKLKINSNIRVASIDPNSTIHNTILYDNIGLFKNSYWKDNPEIIFNVSEVGTPITSRTIDVSPFVNY